MKKGFGFAAVYTATVLLHCTAIKGGTEPSPASYVTFCSESLPHFHFYHDHCQRTGHVTLNLKSVTSGDTELIPIPSQQLSSQVYEFFFFTRCCCFYYSSSCVMIFITLLSITLWIPKPSLVIRFMSLRTAAVERNSSGVLSEPTLFFGAAVS